MAKKFIYSVLTIVFSVLIAVGIILAWTEPGVAPPGSNVLTPLNIGSEGQSKIGGLILNTGNATSGLIVQYGNVGIGTNIPGGTFDVKAGTNCTAGSGDVDDSGKIMPGDAGLVLKHVTGIIVLSPAEFARGDVDGDCILTDGDATDINALAVGKTRESLGLPPAEEGKIRFISTDKNGKDTVATREYVDKRCVTWLSPTGSPAALQSWNNASHSNFKPQRLVIPGTNCPAGSGDVDNSGSIMPGDATKVLQHVTGVIVLSPAEIARGDVDGDCVLTSGDATYIANLVVGKTRESLGLLPTGETENICNDGDGCIIYMMQFTDANAVQWGVHETNLIYQFRNGKWTSSIEGGSDGQGTNGNGTREYIGGYDYCDIIDDEVNYGENSAESIILLDGNNVDRCFFRICD